jgi:hypothetical protein
MPAALDLECTKRNGIGGPRVPGGISPSPGPKSLVPVLQHKDPDRTSLPVRSSRPVRAQRKEDIRIQSDPRNAQPQIRRVAQPRTDSHGRRQAQSAAIHVGLHFVSLLREVEVGFGGYEYGGDVVERVLLLLG